MKNKFMTKALAVVLSASMALSLSSATALTANGAAAPKLAKKAVTVNAGKKAKNKLAKASFKAGWRITKATVKKTKVAKAIVKKNKKVVVVTGVQKGKTKVVVALKNAKTGAAKKVKFTVKVKVDEVKPEPVVVEAASIVSATQKTTDEAVITFSKAPETDVTLDTLKIYEGGKEYVPTAVTMANDKLSATVTFAYAASTDTTVYEYTFKDANLSGEASFKTAKYEVAKIDVKDQTVEAGSLQPVTFALLTENGVDITKANAGALLRDVNVDFVGDDVVDKDPSATKPQVFLSEAGKTCKFTVTYLPGQEKEKKAEATITAVQPTKTDATARWASYTDKWYLKDQNVTSVSYYNGSGDQTMYFYAKQLTSGNSLGFKAVEYGRGFEIKSSDENVATAIVRADSNKLAVVTITPVAVGTTTLTLTATEEKGEGVDSTFELPVRIAEFNENADQLKVTTTNVNLTNAVDVDYSATVGLNLFNSNDEVLDHSYSFEVFNNKNEDALGILNVVDAGQWKEWANGFGGQVAHHIKIKADDAPAGTYRIVVKATGVQGSDTKEFSKTIYVAVKDVASRVADGGFKYEFELAHTALSITDDGGDKDTTVSIKAMIGSNFAGYVRRNAGSYHIGSYAGPTITDTALTGVNIYVLSGAKYIAGDFDSDGEGAFYLGSEAIAAKDVSGKSGSYSSGNNLDSKNLAVVSLYSRDGATVNYFGNSKNEGIAAAGTYNIIAYNHAAGASAINADGKLEDGVQVLAAKKAINVSYKLTMPNIDYNKAVGNDYVTPDKDFLKDRVNNADVEVIVAKESFAKYKSTNPNGTVRTWAADEEAADAKCGIKDNNRLSVKATVKAVIIKYTDRGKNPIYFVVEKNNTITE